MQSETKYVRWTYLVRMDVAPTDSTNVRRRTYLAAREPPATSDSAGWHRFTFTCSHGTHGVLEAYCVFVGVASPGPIMPTQSEAASNSVQRLDRTCQLG